VFRVVRYLPGTPPSDERPDLRVGVAQASGEETAKNANAGVQGANAMGIWAAASQPKPAIEPRQCAIVCAWGLAQRRWSPFRWARHAF
jgi:hypothetical protein